MLFFAFEDVVQFEPQIVEVVAGRRIGKQLFDCGQEVGEGADRRQRR
jgi:hypothetical protein